MKNIRCQSIRSKEHTLHLWVLVGLGFFGTRTALAADYYVATTVRGNESAPSSRGRVRLRVQQVAVNIDRKIAVGVLPEHDAGFGLCVLETPHIE